jgi:hypothetical protein
MYFKLLEKPKQAKYQSNRWKAIIKTRAEFEKMVTKRTMQRINETKVGL